MIPPDPSSPDPPGAGRRWRGLHRQILECTRCVDAGLLPAAAPMFQGRPGQRLMLVGQAPGVVEVGARKPFAGRSGAELARWMQRAGFRDADHFRALTYVTSVTKCYPGKARTGSGDRRPSPAEVGLCLPWLRQQLELVRPRLVLVVGTLAMEHLLPWRPLPGLEQLVGSLFDAGGERVEAPGPGAGEPYLLPLPHPSGASRWLNEPAHRDLLGRALERLALAWPRLVEDVEGSKEV